jgi:hypothetical protein
MGKNEYRRTYLYDVEEELTPEIDRVDAFLDKLFSVLGIILASLIRLCARPTMRRIVRYAGVAICFFCFLGSSDTPSRQKISIQQPMVYGRRKLENVTSVRIS